MAEDLSGAGIHPAAESAWTPRALVRGNELRDYGLTRILNTPIGRFFRASQLGKRFAKLRGRTTGDSSKRPVEIRHGLKSAGEGSFANSRVGIEQKCL